MTLPRSLATAGFRAEIRTRDSHKANRENTRTRISVAMLEFREILLKPKLEEESHELWQVAVSHQRSVMCPRSELKFFEATQITAFFTA